MRRASRTARGGLHHGLLGVLLAHAACGSENLPRLDAGAQAVQMKAPLRFHATEGFIKLEPPAHIPTSDPTLDQVEVWLRMGEGRISTARAPDGRSVLVFPPGTRADRVEHAGRGEARRIVDIRGTTLTATGPRFHVFRPSAPEPEAPLFGAQWPSDAPAAHQAATDYLAASIRVSEPWASMPPQRRARELRDFRAKNECLPCHEPGRPENVRPGQHGLVNRGTDGSGFFTPSTLFSDDVPLEAYGAHDRTLDDPVVDLVCEETVVAHLRERSCPDGQVPRARWNWARAWSTAPDRARLRCNVAALLYAEMNAPAKASVASFFDNCGITYEK